VSKTLLYPRFWEKFLDRLRELHPEWSGAGVPSSQGWMGFRSTLSYTHPTCGFAAGDRLRSELFIDSLDQNRNRRIFNALERQKREFESIYGRSLSWEPLPHARMCRIADYRDNGNVTFQDRHDEYIEWFIDAGERLRRATGSITPPDI
jgi:hypothetical protein